MTIIDLIDKHAEGFGLLGFFALISLTIIGIAVASAFDTLFGRSRRK